MTDGFLPVTVSNTSMASRTFAGRLLQYIPEEPRRKFVGVLNQVHPLSLALLYSQSILTEYGWFESRAGGAPIDGDGNELPWMTYSCINFLDGRVDDTRIFEYGSGNSTVWFGNRASEVVAVEHNEEWYRRVKDSMPRNASLYHVPKDSYAASIKSKGPFGMIVIDGIDRNQCIEAAISELSDSGVILLDDSQRDEYESGRQSLQDRGFQEIGFKGLKPINRMPAKTSIYYHSNNCLRI
jgi:hypothetical protein